jgi:hypothetical protein
MKMTYEIFDESDKEKKTLATVAIESDMVVGAEQDVVILAGSNDKPAAILKLQPGYDVREIAGQN